MCGINAIFQPSADSEIEKMNQKLIHRGPDEQKTWRSNKVHLGSTRLKIIDLNEGSMPFHSSCNRFHFVFNGEVYNFKELKKDLKDYQFQSSTDTEVVFALLQKEGVAALKKLNGMFSFAFYDSVEEKLLIVRDRLGIKPLFWAQKGQSFYFSSEINALRAGLNESFSLNKEILSHYLSFLSVPEPFTFYKGIQRFPSAHYAVIEKDKGIQFHPYWKLNFEKSSDSQEEIELEVRHKFKESVNRRLVSDVPLGVFLSGGIDSNIIATEVSQLKDDSKLKTFCMSFDNGLDESLLAEKSAESLNSDHHHIRLSAKELQESIPQILRHFGEPFAGGLPLYFLCREVQKDVTVILSGTGGDEMFGNYGRIQHLRPRLGKIQAFKSFLKKAWPDLGKEAKRYFIENGQSLGHFYHEKCAPTKSHLIDQLLINKSYDSELLLNEKFWSLDNLELEDRVFYGDLNIQLKDEFLYSQDILSMAHSLELRVPFLDHEFVELMAKIPVNLRSNAADPKSWMKKVFKSNIPDHIRSAPKTGFMIPYGEWMRGPFKYLLDHYFSKEVIKERNLFDYNLINILKNEHLEGKDHTYTLWSLLMFQLWLAQEEDRNFIF